MDTVYFAHGRGYIVVSRNPNVRSLTAGVWQVRLQGIEPGGVNAYIVDDGALTLIDSGMVWDAKTIRRALSRLGWTVDDVDRVLLTHYDVDHVGGLLRMNDLDAAVYLGVDDLAVVSGSARTPQRSHKHLLHRVVARFVGVPAGTRGVVDHQQIGNFTAYHSPGHNPGHMVYVHSDRSFAALGDLVRSNGGTLHPMYWFDSYDLSESKRSIRTLAARIPPVKVVGPGHGPPISRAGHHELTRLASTV